MGNSDNFMQQNSVTVTLYLIGSSENTVQNELEGEAGSIVSG